MDNKCWLKGIELRGGERSLVFVKEDGESDVNEWGLGGGTNEE